MHAERGIEDHVIHSSKVHHPYFAPLGRLDEVCRDLKHELAAHAVTCKQIGISCSGTETPARMGGRHGVIGLCGFVVQPYLRAAHTLYMNTTYDGEPYLNDLLAYCR